MKRTVADTSVLVSATILIFIFWFISVVLFTVFVSSSFGSMHNLAIIASSILLLSIITVYIWLPWVKSPRAEKRRRK